MLAKRVEAIPEGAGWIFEPKWDGFRVLVFRDGDELLLQSRDAKSRRSSSVIGVSGATRPRSGVITSTPAAFAGGIAKRRA